MTASYNTDHRVRHCYLCIAVEQRGKKIQIGEEAVFYFLITWVIMIKNICSVHLKCKFTFVGPQKVTQTFLLHTTQYSLTFSETSQQSKLIQLPLNTERKMHENK